MGTTQHNNPDWSCQEFLKSDFNEVVGITSHNIAAFLRILHGLFLLNVPIHAKNPGSTGRAELYVTYSFLKVSLSRRHTVASLFEAC